jgi:hypothetical protein
MRDMLTLDRIQVENSKERGPFVVVGAPQAGQIRELLDGASLDYQMLTHDFTDDVMFEFNQDANPVEIQTILDQTE